MTEITFFFTWVRILIESTLRLIRVKFIHFVLFRKSIMPIIALKEYLLIVFKRLQHFCVILTNIDRILAH